MDLIVADLSAGDLVLADKGVFEHHLKALVVCILHDGRPLLLQDRPPLLGAGQLGEALALGQRCPSCSCLSSSFARRSINMSKVFTSADSGMLAMATAGQ